MQPVQYRQGIRHVVIATKSKYQASCGVEYGLQTSLEIGRKPNKHEVAIIELRVDGRDHERTKSVVVDVKTQMRKLLQCYKTVRHGSIVRTWVAAPRSLDVDAQVTDNADWFD